MRIAIAIVLCFVACKDESSVSRNLGDVIGSDEVPELESAVAATKTAAPVEALFADVVAGKFSPGQRVTFDGVFVPEFLIQTESTEESTQQYGLVVAQDDPYLQELAKIADELDGMAKKAARMGKLVKREKKFLAMIKEYEGIVGRVNGARVDVTKAAAIALRDFGMVSLDVSFETVLREGSFSDFQLEPIEIPKLDLATVKSVNSDLAELERESPPNVKSSMPNIGAVLPPLGFDAAEVRRYNRMVTRFNKELMRRRKYLAHVLPAQCAGLAHAMRKLAQRAPQAITATVRDTADSLASRTYREIYKADIAAVLSKIPVMTMGSRRPISPPPPCRIISYPAATLWIDGEKKGKTPYIAENIPVATDIAIRLQAKKRRTLEKRINVKASAHRLVQIEEALITKRGKKR